MNINWRFILSKWWKATLMGLLIAIGIALFPQANVRWHRTAILHGICGAMEDNLVGVVILQQVFWR